MADPKQALKAMSTALEALEALEPDERQRAMNWLGETLEVRVLPGESPGAGPGSQGGERQKEDGSAGSPETEGSAQTPREFLAEKEPKTDVERVACLAYYLTKFRDTPSFKARELTDLNTEAAGQKFNTSRAATNALNQNGYVAHAGKGHKQITPLGERVVDALPNQEAVAQVIASAPKRRKRSTGKRKLKKAKRT